MQLLEQGAVEWKAKSYWKMKREKETLNLDTCEPQIMILYSPIGFCDIGDNSFNTFSFPIH